MAHKLSWLGTTWLRADQQDQPSDVPTASPRGHKAPRTSDINLGQSLCPALEEIRSRHKA